MDFFQSGERNIAGMRPPDAGSVDERMMMRALELAEKGRGMTSPNPVVGAVIARGDQVISEGYHERVGGPHAEINALDSAPGGLRGATMYVTLEPCSHQGRTPPCAPRVADSGIERVVIAVRDPNPQVAGGGEALLKDHGVEVSVGLFGRFALRQNEEYLKWVRTRRPFVTLKMAMSLDGKVATRTGDSKWISSEISRADVQRARAASDAVMVGIGTVMSDNPRLNVRDLEGVRQPLRVVVDSFARTPVGSNVADSSMAPTLLAVSENAPEESIRALEATGVELMRLDDAGKVDLGALLELLGERGVTSLLVEGGPELARGMWQAGLVDKFVFYFAPKIVGGCEAPGPVGGTGVACMKEAGPLTIDAAFEMGPDLKVVAYPGGE